jgi:hypothetical protein
LELTIYRESKVERDFGVFLLGIVGGIAANYATRLIDRIKKEVVLEGFDEDEKQEGAEEEAEEAEREKIEGTDATNAAGSFEGTPTAYFIFNGETYDLRVEADRNDLIDAINDFSRDD